MKKIPAERGRRKQMNGLAKYFRKVSGKVIALAVIAAMCFAFAVTGFAVRGYAAEGSVNTTDLVTVSENASTRVSTDTENDKIAKGGLLIESDTLYTGAINGKFEGDVTLGFGFRDNTGFSDGMDFFIDIKDAADPSNMFTVKYRTLNTWDGTGYSGAFVLYGDQVRSSQYWGYDTTWYNQEMSAEGPICSPMFSGYQGNQFGYLKLVWNEDVLQVQVTNHNSDTDIRTIAAFDGTDSFVSGTSWGLPTLSFPQGYTISFRTTDKAPDMYIYSVEAYEETVDFSTETQTTAPQFYTAWQTSDTVTIDVDKTPLTGAVGHAVSVPAATVTVGSGEPQAVYKVSVSGPAGFEAADITSAMSFTPTVAGNYTITYQGVEESESETNTATVSCTVYNYTAASSLIAENEVVKVDAGKVSTSISADGSVTGLRATFGAGDSSFTFNTVFTGDFNIFLQSDLMEVKGGFSEVRLRFKDINNGENYVDVVMMPGIASWANWYTHMLVEYKGEMYTTNKSADNSGTVWNTDQINANKYQTTAGWYEAAGLTDFLANMTERTDTGYTTGYIGFDSETLSFLTEQGGNRYIVASFTDAKYEWTNDFTGFANGYTVEVLAYGAAEGASITMTQLNGVSLSETYLPANMGEQKSILYGEAEKSIEAVQGTYEDEGALLYTLVEGFGFGIIDGDAPYTVIFNGEDAEAVDLTKVGTVYTLVYEGGAQRTVTVLPDKTAPTIAFNGVSSEVIVLLGEGLGAMNTDVTVTDALDGVISSDKVTITVKAPEASEFTAFSADYRFDRKGVYILRYEALDAAGNVGYLDRTIVVKDGTAPSLTVNGTVGENYYVGQSASLPSAEAEKGNNAFDVLVSVTLDGETVFSGNGANANNVRFDRPGTYTVTYYAADDEIVPNETVKTYTITVIEDTEAPVISVDFTQTTAKPGDVITLPAATATDNADEDVTVNVRVQFGNEEVSVSNGQFTAEHEGTYTIIYSAADDSGQASDLRFTITVLDAGETQGEGTGCSGTVLTTAGGIALGVGMIAAAVVLCRKKGKKIN